MYFDRPLFLWLLLLLPLLWIGWSRYLSTGRRVRGIWGMDRGQARTASLRERCSVILLGGVFASLVIALAGPYLRQVAEDPNYQQKNLVFLLDASPSMNAQDVWPSRMERAKEVIQAFVQRETEVARFGLVSFSESSIILSYLTSDPQNLLFYLDYLRPDRRVIYGTDIGAAIHSGLQVLERHSRTTEQVEESLSRGVVVLISDGEDTGENLPEALDEARQMGVRVHAVGVGTSEGAIIPLVEEGGARGYLEDDAGVPLTSLLMVDTLREIADETGGNFFQAASGPELEEALLSILRSEREVLGYRVGLSRWEIFDYFVGLALFSQVVAMVLRF